jgi:hypothetical protein
MCAATTECELLRFRLFSGPLVGALLLTAGTPAANGGEAFGFFELPLLCSSISAFESMQALAIQPKVADQVQRFSAIYNNECHLAEDHTSFTIQQLQGKYVQVEVFRKNANQGQTSLGVWWAKRSDITPYCFWHSC